MGLILFANNAKSSLAGGISSGSTTANLAAGTGALFPNPTGGAYFAMTFTDNATKLIREIVYVTARSTDTITMLRGQEGTTALSWLAGDLAENLWTAGSAAAMVQVAALQVQATNSGTAGGSANALTLTLTPPPASLASIIGSPIRVIPTANNTGSATIAINGLAATAIKNPDGSNLVPSQLVAGIVTEMYYNGSFFQVPFPVVQQGTGVGQSQNGVKIGWTGSTLLGQVDGTQLGPFAFQSWVTANYGGLAAGNVWTGNNIFQNTGAGGVTVQLTGNGSTTPKKFINVLSGALRFLNDAFNVAIATLTDAGNFSVSGSLTAATTVSAGTSMVAGNTITASAGNIVAATGRLRAALGATGSGDTAVATLLGDFQIIQNGSAYAMRLPNGKTQVWGFATGPSVANGTGSEGFAVTLSGLDTLTLTPANNNAVSTSAWILTTANTGFTFSCNQANVNSYYFGVGTT